MTMKIHYWDSQHWATCHHQHCNRHFSVHPSACQHEHTLPTHSLLMTRFFCNQVAFLDKGTFVTAPVVVKSLHTLLCNYPACSSICYESWYGYIFNISLACLVLQQNKKSWYHKGVYLLSAHSLRGSRWCRPKPQSRSPRSSCRCWRKQPEQQKVNSEQRCLHELHHPRRLFNNRESFTDQLGIEPEPHLTTVCCGFSLFCALCDIMKSPWRKKEIINQTPRVFLNQLNMWTNDQRRSSLGAFWHPDELILTMQNTWWWSNRLQSI